MKNLSEKLPGQIMTVLPFVFFLIFLYKWAKFSRCNRKLLLPPCPPKLPILGNLHQLTQFPHRSLRTLSDKYGEFMLLYLGNKPTLIISSAKAAEEIMKTHDLVFANRPKLRFINRIFYDGNDLAFNSYGEKWRFMKSTCVLQLLTHKRVQSFRPIREEEVGEAIEEIKSYDGSVLNLSEILMTLTKSIISRTTLGKKYDDISVADVKGDGIYGSGIGFHQLFKELIEVMGEPSVGDYIPFLGWVDRLTGLEGRVEIVSKKFDEFMERVVQEHQTCLNEEDTGDQTQKIKDFVDVLLQVQTEKPEELSRENIKALGLDLFIAGTESSSTILEWAMVELIKQPNVMKKLQEEVRLNVNNKEKVTEDDLNNMKYLKAVIKETLRLHPPSPLLIFRESSNEVKVDKYDILARTQVIVNAWAIQQDPKYWKDPEKFIPERFFDVSNSCIDFKGQHFQYIPFGSGRRGCPATSFAIIGAEFVLSSLVYEFDWSLPDGRKGESIDVTESAGFTIRPRNPLMVIATPAIPRMK